MADSNETSRFQWILAVGVAFAIGGLIGYARGEQSDDGQVPDKPVVVVVDRD